MRSTGRYCSVTAFDLDHEINEHCDNAKQAAKDLDANYSEGNARAIKKAIIQTLIDTL